MDYDEHVEAGEQCFGSRFCWPGVACAFANWPCIGKLFFFPNLRILVAQSSIYILRNLSIARIPICFTV